MAPVCGLSCCRGHFTGDIFPEAQAGEVHVHKGENGEQADDTQWLDAMPRAESDDMGAGLCRGAHGSCSPPRYTQNMHGDGGVRIWNQPSTRYQSEVMNSPGRRINLFNQGLS